LVTSFVGILLLHGTGVPEFAARDEQPCKRINKHSHDRASVKKQIPIIHAYHRVPTIGKIPRAKFQPLEMTPTEK